MALTHAPCPLCRKRAKAEEDGEDLKDDDDDEDQDRTKKEECKGEDEAKDAEALEVRDVRYNIENLVAKQHLLLSLC